jgi:predicted AlkP superfamily phosphohydrolase/phosphomutase
MSPDVHGITEILVQDPDTGELVPPTSNLRKVKAIWNILSEHKKRVGIFGYRISWPAEKVNGMLISDRAEEGQYFSPGYSEPPFTKLCSERTFDDLKKMGTDSDLVKFDYNIQKDIFISNFATYLLKNQKFDFSCLYLTGIDVSSHHYWKYMFPEGREIPKADIKKFKNVIKDTYAWCDTVIGNLLKSVDKDTTVIIVSDHGFKGKAQEDDKYIFSKIDSIFEVADLKKLKYNSKTIDLKITPEQIWMPKNNIKITGDFTQEEFNAIRQKVADTIAGIKFKETGRPVFNITNYIDSGFILETQMFTLDHKPQYHLLINGREYKMSDFMIKDPFSGEHAPYAAVIIMSGANIWPGRQLKNASIYDIAPTILYLSGLAVPLDMPGKVLTSALDLGLFNKRPVRYIKTYEKQRKKVSEKPFRLPKEEEVIKERMRSLGYIN